MAGVIYLLARAPGRVPRRRAPEGMRCPLRLFLFRVQLGAPHV